MSSDSSKNHRVLIQELSNVLTQNDGTESSNDKTIGVICVSLLSILDHFEDLSGDELSAISHKLERVKNIQVELQKYTPEISILNTKINEVLTDLKRNQQASPTFDSLQYIFDSQKYLITQLNTLSTILSFFQTLNEPLSQLRDRLEKLDPTSEDLDTRKNKLQKFTDANNEISELENSIKKIEGIIHGFLSHVKITSEKITGQYYNMQRKLVTTSEQDDDNMRSSFQGFSTDKNGYILHENLMLTSLYEDIFEHIGNINGDQKADVNAAILKIQVSASSRNLYQSGQIPDSQIFHSIKNIYQLLQQVETPYQKLIQLFRTRTEIQSSFKVNINQKEEEPVENHCNKGTDKLINGFCELEQGKISGSNIFTTEVETHAGDLKLCKIKQEAFKIIDAIFNNLHDEEKVTAYILTLIKIYQNYNDTFDEQHGYKKTNKRPLDEVNTRKSYHYVVRSDEHDKITGFREIETSIPPKSVGQSIDQVKEKIQDIITRDELWGNFKDLFIGHDNSLNNLLLLGPYGTGKTALIRELAHDNNIATLEAQASDLLSIWYGVAEKNPKLLFEQAAKIHAETGKKVFILIDEFDQIFKLSSSSDGNQSEMVQKEMQILLDGITEYKGVHLIGLSNEPESIPPAMVRRMDTLITQKLNEDEKIELIQGRFTDINLDKDLLRFFERIPKDIDRSKIEKLTPIWYLKKHEKVFSSLNTHEKSEAYFDYICQVGTQVSEAELLNSNLDKLKNTPQMSESDRELLKYFIASTPKILTSICQIAYKKCLLRMAKELGEAKMQRHNKKLGTYKSQKGKQEFLKRIGFQISFEDFLQAGKEIFSNPTITRQIQTNEEFYKYIQGIGLS